MFNILSAVDMRIEYRCANCDDVHEAEFEGDPTNAWQFVITLAANGMGDFTVFRREFKGPWIDDTAEAIEGLDNLVNNIMDTLNKREDNEQEWNIDNG